LLTIIIKKLITSYKSCWYQTDLPADTFIFRPAPSISEQVAPSAGTGNGTSRRLQSIASRSR